MSRSAARAPVPDLAEGSVLVAELGMAAGVMAWRALRDLRQWPGPFPPGLAARRRGDLRRAGLPEALSPALDVLAGLADVDPESVVDADRAVFADACRRVVWWCRGRGARHAAAAFESAAAAFPGVSPSDGVVSG